MEIDIALAVEEIIPAARYRRAGTYAELAATWLDVRPLPAESDLRAAWQHYLQRQAAEKANSDAEQAKLDAARAANAEPFDPSKLEAANPTMAEILKRIDWLEKEIRALTR